MFIQTRITTLALLVIVAITVSCSPRNETIQGSSLLLITLDTTRADLLGCYGGPEWITPNLDRLAREGIRFDQARSVAPVPLPSHATILTGLLPFEHGVRDNATFRLPPEVTTLAERLKAAGYRTAAVMGAFVLHSTFGLDQGFDIYLDVPQHQLTLGTAEDQRRANEVVDEALKILKSSAKTEPFFLWVHFSILILPIILPGPFSTMLSERDSDPGSLRENCSGASTGAKWLSWITKSAVSWTGSAISRRDETS